MIFKIVKIVLQCNWSLKMVLQTTYYCVGRSFYIKTTSFIKIVKEVYRSHIRIDNVWKTKQVFDFSEKSILHSFCRYCSTFLDIKVIVQQNSLDIAEKCLLVPLDCLMGRVELRPNKSMYVYVICIDRWHCAEVSSYQHNVCAAPLYILSISNNAIREVAAMQT